MNVVLDRVIRRTLAAFKPPPNMTIAQWADEFRFLSAESSASPGRFKTEIVEYMREPMEMIGRAGVRRVTLMTSAQVAKSTVIENVIGYFVDLDPCPILHVSPTLDSMKMFSKERLAPMIRDCPVLRDKVKDARSRDSNNTLNSKSFPGGHIAMVGANAPAGLASRPIRVVLFDEVDRYESSAGTEGDPINLAVKRTTTYWNRVIVMVSTPVDKSTSRIEPEFLRGDQRYRWVPCPHCDHMQKLKWANVKFDSSDPDSARYMCDDCGALWTDAERNRAVRLGEWRPEKPWNGNVSYHISQLYSPFAPLSDGVRDFLSSKDNPQLLKTWVNTFLGETWEERGKRLDWTDLLDQREDYSIRDPVPEEVTVITAGVDMQDDRAEIEWVGWGDDHRSWNLGYRRVYGDPSTPQFWTDLGSALDDTFVHPLFGEMAPRAINVDSGGHYTQHVYAFVARRPRTYAIKGVGGEGKPIFGKPSRNTVGGHPVFPLGVDTIKELVAQRLRQRNPDAAGYCAFPADTPGIDDDYFQGLTSEELRTRYHKGFPKKEWCKISNRIRNEPFDCRVYATGALEMLGLDLNATRRAMLQEARDRVKPREKPARRRVEARDNWVDSWKHD